MDAGNPFLAAINSIPTGNDPYASPSFLPSVLQNAQSQARGVDLSGFNRSIPMPSALTQDLVNSGSWGRSTGAPVLPAALSGSQQQSGPGFWGNVWNGITGGYNHLQGMLQGEMAPGGHSQPMFMNMLETFSPLGMLNMPGTIMRDVGGIKGLINPAQAHQNYQTALSNTDQAINSTSLPGVLKATARIGAHAAADTATDPLSYVPFEKPAAFAAKAAGLTPAAKYIADLFKGSVKETPYAAFGWQSKAGKPLANVLAKAMPNGAPDAIRAPLNAVTSVFKPIAGARQTFLNAVSRMTGKTQSGTNKIMKTLQTIFENTTPEQRVALTHAMESTAPGTVLSDPALESLRQQIEPLMEQATQHSLDRGLISNTINPEEYGVGRYIPHVSATKLDPEAVPFSDISNVTTRNPSIDASKSRGLEGTIQALNNASDKKMFEDDLAKILTYHFGQINKASTARDLIDEAMQHGIETGGELKAGQQFPGTLQKAMEYSHGGNTVLLPESEARYLQQLSVPKSELSQVTKGAYRGAVNGFNRLMFLTSPFIHILNNLGTQTLTHAPGVFAKMPKYMKEAWKGVEPGSQMDDALRSGALHLSSVMHGASTPKQMANQIGKNLDGVSNPFKKAWDSYQQLTPRVEQAYRAAAFEHALGKGMSPDEAANWVRGIYGGRIAGDAASPAENAITSVMPFFNWSKTAIGSNAKNVLRNPVPYVAGYHAMDDYNRDVSGHGMADNPNPLSLALPWKDKNGNPEYYAPYAPPFDVGKLIKSIGKNGPIGGTADFAFSRTNPLAKYLVQSLTHEQNPFALPLNKYNVQPNPALAQFGPQFNERGIAFGDKGPKAPAPLAQLLQDISNPVGTAIDLQGESPLNAILTQLLGGSVSAPNPASAQKNQQWNQNEILRELKSYTKKQSSQ